MNPDFWRSKRVLITGHTGFKGSWLALWLQSLGAQLTGLALPPPTNPSLFELTHADSDLRSVIADIRDAETVAKVIREARPEIVFHLAAQPLVRRAYYNPSETYGTNVMGLVNVLEAIRQLDTPPRAVLIITSDKCYENREWPWPYRESDPVGGSEPYASSKACAELIVGAYRNTYFTATNPVALATARAGNVIGGGDWSEDRLLPDIVRAFNSGKTLRLRNPNAIRPWQHILDPLAGYLALAEKLHSEGQAFAEAWNFGPDPSEARTVNWMVKRLSNYWPTESSPRWETDPSPSPAETQTLKLDSSKARARLGWVPRWNLAFTLENTASWYRAWSEGASMRSCSLQQINDFTANPQDAS